MIQQSIRTPEPGDGLTTIKVISFHFSPFENTVRSNTRAEAVMQYKGEYQSAFVATHQERYPHSVQTSSVLRTAYEEDRRGIVSHGGL